MVTRPSGRIASSDWTIPFSLALALSERAQGEDEGDDAGQAERGGVDDGRIAVIQQAEGGTAKEEANDGRGEQENDAEVPAAPEQK